MFSVDPDLQNSGIGRQLLTAAEVYAKSTFGSHETHMGVIHTRKELLAWYNRRGYLPTVLYLSISISIDLTVWFHCQQMQFMLSNNTG
jgi:GNAT superfamily N-acetyltransferase